MDGEVWQWVDPPKLTTEADARDVRVARLEIRSSDVWEIDENATDATFELELDPVSGHPSLLPELELPKLLGRPRLNFSPCTRGRPRPP